MTVTSAGSQARAENASAILAERMRMLTGNSLYIIVGGHLFCATAVLPGIHWLSSPPGLIHWWIAIVGVTIVRGCTILHWRRGGVPVSRATSVARRFTLFSAAAGAVWGVGAVVFFDPTNIPATALLCVVLAGLATGGIGPVAAYFPAYAAFATIVLTPLSLALLLQPPGVLWFLAAVGFALLAVCLAAGRVLAQRIGESIALRFENRDLIADLEAKRREAERANEAKSRFLAAASHDLRQPLNALSLAVDMLDEADDPTTRADLVRSIRSSVNATNDVLTGLLDVSRLDAGVVRPAPRPVELASMLQHLETMFAPVARERDLTLRVHPTRARVQSDPALLGSILQNLVGNAIRYVPRGGRVMLAVRRRGLCWRIEVRDNGPGIPFDQQQRVFDDFTRGQADSGESGLGLGLAIVRRASELLGHRLDLRSAVGRGSTFSLEIADAAVSPPESPGSPPGATTAFGPILLLATDPLSRTRLRTLLQDRDLEVDAPMDIDAASRRLVASNPPHELLIVDGDGHGTFDGIDAVRWLTARTDRPLPALLLTSDISPGLRRRARATGIRLVQKPPDAQRLLAAIAEIAPQRH